MLRGLFSSCGKWRLLSSCGAWAPHWGGFSCCGAQTREHRLNSVAHELTCSVACGAFPDQGSNPCLLHWQVDSLPLSHQGSLCLFLNVKFLLIQPGLYFLVLQFSNNSKFNFLLYSSLSHLFLTNVICFHYLLTICFLSTPIRT